MTGVSTQTVSRVINNRPDVSPETRRAVEAAIAEHGFQPSAVARSLVQRRSQMLGVIVAGLKYFGVAQTVNGMAEATEAAGYSIILKELGSFDLPDIVPVVEFFVAHRVEGIIFAPPQMGANIRHLQEQLPPSTPPVIFLKAEPSERFQSDRHRQRGGRPGRHPTPPGAGPHAGRAPGRTAGVARGPRPSRRLARRAGRGGPRARTDGRRRLDVRERRRRVRADPGGGPGGGRAVRGERPDGPGRHARRQRARDPHPGAARRGGLRRDPRGGGVHAVADHHPPAAPGDRQARRARSWWPASGPRRGPVARTITLPTELVLGDSAPMPATPAGDRDGATGSRTRPAAAASPARARRRPDPASASARAQPAPHRRYPSSAAASTQQATTPSRASRSNVARRRTVQAATSRPASRARATGGGRDRAPQHGHAAAAQADGQRERRRREVLGVEPAGPARAADPAIATSVGGLERGDDRASPGASPRAARRTAAVASP